MYCASAWNIRNLKRAVREQYERFRPSVVCPTVRLRSPRGVSHVQLFSGIHRAVAADGTVEMTESDAAPLLNAGWVRVEAGDLSGTEAVVF